MKYLPHAAAAIAAVVLCTTAVRADDCKPLALVQHLALSTSPDLRRLYVPVEIGGKPKELLLDTGAAVTMIDRSLADDLGLQTRDSPVRIFDLTGATSDRYVETSFTLGRLAFPKFQLQVGAQLQDPDEPGMAGLLGASFLTFFDISIDPAGKTLDLIRPDHCPNKVIFWPTTAIAMIPFTLDGGALIVDLKLDGRPIKAILDTGASNSTLRINAAERFFDIKPGSPDAPVSGVLNSNERLTTYHHVFKTLDFDGVVISNLDVELIPDRVTREFNEKPTGSLIGVTPQSISAPMLIGMDVLRHTRLYISYKTHMLYVTPPTGPAAAAPAPVPTK